MVLADLWKWSSLEVLPVRAVAPPVSRRFRAPSERFPARWESRCLSVMRWEAMVAG